MLKFVFLSLLTSNLILASLQMVGGQDSSGREPQLMSAELNAEKLVLHADNLPNSSVAQQQPEPQPPEIAVAPQEDLVQKEAPQPEVVLAQAAPPQQEQPQAQPAIEEVAQAPSAAPAEKDLFAEVAKVVTMPIDAPTKEPETASSSCLYAGAFGKEDGKAFLKQLRKHAPAVAVNAHHSESPISYIVYLPPEPSLGGALKQVDRLRKKGVDDYFVLQNHPKLKWGVSLGLFKSEQGARDFHTKVKASGIADAQIGEYNIPKQLVHYELRNMKVGDHAQITRILSRFPEQQLTQCNGGTKR